MNSPISTIRALKFDGSVHRVWQAEFMGESKGLLTFRGTFKEPVSHPELGRISKGTVSVEYFWRDKWHNVFRFYEPNGTFRNFYCNVSLPPSFDGSILEFTDLDLDIYVGSDRKIEILDIDEFEQNARLYGYGETIQKRALSELDLLVGSIEKREFPFDSTRSLEYL